MTMCMQKSNTNVVMRLQVLQVYALCLKYQNPDLKFLVMFFNNEGYSWVSYEDINCKNIKILPHFVEMAASEGVGSKFHN